MHFIIPIKYIYKNISFFLLYSENIFKNNIILFIPDFTIFYVIFFFKYSYFFKNFLLIDLGIYEIPNLCYNNILIYKNILWYIFKNLIDIFIFLFSIVNKNSIYSIEVLFRNAKWLEKEGTDFFNIFFKNKNFISTNFDTYIFYSNYIITLLA